MKTFYHYKLRVGIFNVSVDFMIKFSAMTHPNQQTVIKLWVKECIH